MAVKNNDSIVIDYTLTNTTDSEFVSSGETFQIQLGMHTMLPGFESGMVGMEVNETKTITLTAANAWGEYDPSLRSWSPNLQYLLPSGATLSDYPVGAKILHLDPPAIIVGITGETATVDSNNFLAGKNLSMEVTLKEIKVLPTE